jgi:hypothetical protein
MRIERVVDTNQDQSIWRKSETRRRQPRLPKGDGGNSKRPATTIGPVADAEPHKAHRVTIFWLPRTFFNHGPFGLQRDCGIAPGMSRSAAILSLLLFANDNA